MEKYQKIETIEKKYLNKFYHFLKSFEDEMLEGFQTKEDIKSDWIEFWGSDGHSDFDVGAERIVYALFNGKGIGQPNSCPVGSDLFFETKDAYIHIDLKTVEASGNIGDYVSSIFVGENQNSYKGTIKKRTGYSEEYNPSLPTFYNKGKSNEKICLSYFITILYEKENLDILNINLICMPNGELEPFYKEKPLAAGKNPGKARFKFSKTPEFETLKTLHESNNSRIKVIFLDKKKCEEKGYQKKLSVFFNLSNI